MAADASPGCNLNPCYGKMVQSVGFLSSTVCESSAHA